MRFNHGIIDAHVHGHGGPGVDQFLRNAHDHYMASGLDMECILSVRHGRSGCITDAEALLMKAEMPDWFRIYCNPAWRIEGFDGSPEGVREQIRLLTEAGSDGVKLGDGESGFDVTRDDPMYDPLFTYCEENNVPVLYHVGGAVTIPARRVIQKSHEFVEGPPWLRYTEGVDDDKPAKDNVPLKVMENKWDEVDRMLQKHPRLKVTFAHFLFLYEHFDRLSALFDKYPCMKVDLTPCFDIYYSLSKHPEKAREFICDYKDRFIFGTDNEMEQDPIPHLIYQRAFLETDEPFFSIKWGVDLHGIRLPEDVLKLIYKNNYLERVDMGRKVDPVKAAEYADWLYDTVRDFPELPETHKAQVREVAARFRAMR